MRNVFVGDAVTQNDELIATNASNDVRWASGVHQALGNIGEQHVAHVVANGVVHIFQVVEVNKEHCGSRFYGAAAVECFGKFAQEQHAVRKPGERIVRGLAREFVL